MDARSPWIARRSAVALATLAWANTVAWSGSLEPTPGVPASTMKPLDQVEPRVPVQSLPGSATVMFVISQPGSYYLTANIVAAATGKRGIQIDADDVSLDLMGFAVIGAGPGGQGIFVLGSGAAVYNGSIRGWSTGLDAFTASGLHARDLRIHNNGSTGLLTGDGAIVVRCAVLNNGSVGIQVGRTCIISNCLAMNNTGVGILVFENGSISDSTASGNGSDGIVVGDSSIATNCVVRSNLGDGIEVTEGAIALGNIASFNTGAGIRVTRRGNRIEGNTVFRNSLGIRANESNAEGNVIIKNSAMCNPSGPGSTALTNYAVGASNDLGPTGSAATAASPWANISVIGTASCD